MEWDSQRTWNFFIGEDRRLSKDLNDQTADKSWIGKPVLVPGGYFPDDLDTTALALTVLRPQPEVVTSLLDEMVGYVNPDGTIQVSHANSSNTFSLCKIAPIM